MTKAISSSAPSASDSVCAATSALTRSGPGVLRRFSICAEKYARRSSTEVVNSGGSGFPGSVLSPETIASDHRLKVAYSSGSTPSISAITITGSGLARSRITSKSRRSLTLSRSMLVSSRMRGSISRIRRGVKSRLTSLRSRVCTGGSENSIVVAPLNGPRSSNGCSCGGRVLEKCCGSRKIARQSW